jgi:predicted RNA binding protein YcfA (HicA-like mRNA interferase family)
VAAFDKAVQRLLANPPEATFSDVKRVLEGYGWLLSRTEGSHHTFSKQDERDLITVPVHNRRVGRVYVRARCKCLGLSENDADEPEERED